MLTCVHVLAHPLMRFRHIFQDKNRLSVIGYYVVLCFYPILAVEVHVIMTSLFSNLLGGGEVGGGGGMDSSAPFLYEPTYFTFLTDVVLIFYMYMYRYVTIENFIHV